MENFFVKFIFQRVAHILEDKGLIYVKKLKCQIIFYSHCEDNKSEMSKQETSIKWGNDNMKR